ncbi:MAG: hypothetical protein Ta2A_19700 [Treponemataceae bacterium]|nr:MAG: hypothetical protein Ta2A_19700 [Treponemataceae bacterium]
MKLTKIAGVPILSFLLMLASGANAFAQTESDFSVWKHPGVAKHPATDFGTVITGYTGSARAVTIPATINGSPVIGIEDYAFAGNTNITSVVIPDSVKNLGDYAFQNCTALTSVTLPAYLKKIDNGAFSGCTSLKAVTVPASVTKIGFQAFQGCTSLASITVPSGVKRIENWAFASCPALNSASQTAIRLRGYTGTF